MNREALEGILNAIQKTRVAIVGDFCLDIYWFFDMSKSEPSLETGRSTQPTREQRYSLGGAGNILSNLVDLGVGTVLPFGVVGDDPWGLTMLRLLEERGVDTNGMLVQTETWDTLAYAKPHVGDIEQNRIDFGNFNKLPDTTAMKLIEHLESALPDVDVLIINQQVVTGIHTPFLRTKLADLIHQHESTVFLVDCRMHTEEFTGAYLKINDIEAFRACGVATDIPSREDVLASADKLFERHGKPVFITRGSRGCVIRSEKGIEEIPGPHVLGQIDTVGAGDSMLAGLAASLAAGQTPYVAAEMGSYISAVTIQKLHQTGTASPDEILAIGIDPDYVYGPELAADPRQARYLPDTEFELVTSIPDGLRITHAIFDHDGTISTMRQGWEKVMEPVMVRAILGGGFESANESLYQRVVEQVSTYIEQSTGVQTLVQMQGLVRMVREFGCIPEQDILDEHGYKTIYNDELMKIVNARMARLGHGELAIEDFTLKNAVPFLHALHDAGVELYLASGTDQEDVFTEATTMGYASLFGDRIYGSTGDINKEAKRIVLERIMNDIGDDAGKHVVTFGDGPVEIRETRKRGGFAVGVASDEIQRFGINISKRSRLIQAGADLIVSDFSQMDALLRILFGTS